MDAVSGHCCRESVDRPRVCVSVCVCATVALSAIRKLRPESLSASYNRFFVFPQILYAHRCGRIGEVCAGLQEGFISSEITISTRW